MRTAMSGASRALAVERFDERRVVRTVIEAYREAANHKRVLLPLRDTS